MWPDVGSGNTHAGLLFDSHQPILAQLAVGSLLIFPALGVRAGRVSSPVLT